MFDQHHGENFPQTKSNFSTVQLVLSLHISPSSLCPPITSWRQQEDSPFVFPAPDSNQLLPHHLSSLCPHSGPSLTPCRVPMCVLYEGAQPCGLSLPWMCCCTGSDAPSPCSSSTAAGNATDFSGLLKLSWELPLKRERWRPPCKREVSTQGRQLSCPESVFSCIWPFLK